MVRNSFFINLAYNNIYEESDYTLDVRRYPYLLRC